MGRTIRLSLFTLFVGFFTSCLNEFEGNQVIVLSEGLLEVTSEDVTLLGRLLTTTDKPSEIGFYVDVADDFDNPIILQSEQEPDLGSFISSSQLLDFNTEYYAKAYAIVSGQVFFGNLISFKTGSPEIIDVQPKDGAIGDILTISGLNITKDAKVLFGDQEAEILSISDKSIVEVSIPEIGVEAVVDISVQMRDSIFVFDSPFYYHIGSWANYSQFPTMEQNTGMISFVAGDEVIIGYGRDKLENTTNPVFRGFDTPNNSWGIIDSPPGGIPVFDPIKINSGFGGGNIAEFPGLLIQSFDSWELNLTNLEWEKKPSLNVSSPTSAIYCRLNGEDFIFGGVNPDRTTSSIIRKGDIQSGQFVSVDNAPFEISAKEAYFVYDNALYYQRDEFTISKYDPLEQTWVDVFISEKELGTGNIALINNTDVFIGMGSEVKMFRLNLLDGVFVQMNTFPLIAEEENATAWFNNEKIYVLRTTSSLTSRINGLESMVVWELDPYALRQK